MTKLGALVGTLAVLGGCGGTAVPHGPVELDKLRESAIPVWYVGTSFAGLEMTYADTHGADGALIVYGTCETPGGLFADGGCGPPLQISSCSGSKVVVLYGRRSLMRKASKTLRPLNEAARRIGEPYVQTDYGSC